MHCLSRAHCGKCRDRAAGTQFRQSLIGMFEDINVIDFECPYKMPWEKPNKKKSNQFLELFKRAVEDYKNDKWLMSIVHQCKEMYDNPPKGITCRNRKLYKNRWFKKMDYYISERTKQKVKI